MNFFYSIAISIFKKPINNKAIEAKSSWQPIYEFYDMWRQCTAFIWFHPLHVCFHGNHVTVAYSCNPYSEWDCSGSWVIVVRSGEGWLNHTLASRLVNLLTTSFAQLYNDINWGNFKLLVLGFLLRLQVICT